MSIEEESRALNSPERIQYKLLIDNRERELANCIKDMNANIKFELRNLDIGDIQVIYEGNNVSGISMCIERKSVVDLSNSIKDGRYKEQKLRMKALKCSNMGMIIEGKLPPTGFVSGLPVSTIRSAIVSSYIRDKMLVLTTTSVKDTSMYVIKLYEKCQTHGITDNGVKEIEEEEYGEVVSVIKKKNMTKDVCFKAQLKTIPGVSNIIANKIQENYKSMKDIVNDLDNIKDTTSKRKRLAEIVVNSEGKRTRRIGDKVASTIVEYLF